MKILLTHAGMLAALLPLWLAAPAGAQSLGPASADPWIGRPFEMKVPARFAAGDRAECVHADVFYGDQPVPRGRVRATVVGAPEDRGVRVVADAPIDEPIVTVALRAGCTSTVTRTYTLLPAMPTGPVLAAAAARVAGAAPPPAALASPVRLAAATSSTLTRPVRASAAEAPSRARSDRAPRARDGGGLPRLRLDAWEPEPQTLLRVSAQLSQPAQDAAARATAALLWQALNADPADLMRTSLTLQRLEGELAQLRSTADQTRAEMAALRQVLEAPSQGFSIPGPVAQALIVLLLAGAGAASFLWWRTARQGHLGGWHGQPLDSTLDSGPAPIRRVAAQPPVQRAAPAAGEASGRAAPDIPAWTVPGGLAAADAPAARADLAPLDFDLPPVAPPAGGHGPQLRVETLAATFQEVEFLTSLGLRGDATDVLKTYIEDSSAPAPIAFFELMRLYVQGHDDAGHATVRSRYEQLFGSEPPLLEQVDGPEGLQARAELAARITRNWGKPQALDMIEDLLFAVPAANKALSLEAGRDLLCLYQVGLELERDQAGEGEDSPWGHVQDPGLAPWAHAEDAGQAHAAALDAAEFSGRDAFALDLDLNAAAHPVAEPEPQPLALEPTLELTLEPRDPAADALFEEFQDAARGKDRNGGGDADPFSAAVAHESHRPLPR